jgi:hypothetical protein
MRTTLKLTALLVAVCILAFVLAFGAMYGASRVIDGTFNSPHAGASVSEQRYICGTCYVTTVQETTTQELDYMVWAYYYGVAFSAYITCSSEYAAGTASFGDCWGTLGLQPGYAMPIISGLHHYGLGVLFEWQQPLNNYLGFVAF